MNLPFQSLGIDLKGYRLTKKQLITWTSSQTAHTVPLFTGGGVFTSKGDGVYESAEFKFNSVEEFLKFARDFKNIVMWRS